MGACMHVNCISALSTCPCWTRDPGTDETAAGQIYLVELQYMGTSGPACLTIAAEMLRRSAVSISVASPSAELRSRPAACYRDLPVHEKKDTDTHAGD